MGVRQFDNPVSFARAYLVIIFDVLPFLAYYVVLGHGMREGRVRTLDLRV